jgi:predicted metal-binding membrane protein
MTLESLLRRDRAIVAGGLVAVTALAWLYLLHMARHMDMADGMSMAHPMGAAQVVLTFLMWLVMMVGMMMPAAAPMVLVFATVHRKRVESGVTAVPAGIFVAGYLTVWAAVSLVATLTQLGLERAAALSAQTLAATPVVGGVLLIVGGLYQLTPLKTMCLSRCQSPLGFILSEWREGTRGAFVMGLRHGIFCAGCCWALMALLFVAGVMNLLWVAALAAFVLVEKLVPHRRLVSWAAGAGLIGWGIWMLARVA